MSKIKDILITVINILCLVLIAGAVFVMVTVVFTPKGQTPELFGYHVLRITTGSMAPAYKEDTLIFIKHVEPEKIKLGDVISFYSADPALDGAINTHRVTGIEQEDNRILFTTRGDANNADDLYRTDGRSVLGVVFASSLILGKICRLLSNPLIFVPFILLPLVIMLIRNFVQAVRSAKKLEKEEEKELIRKTLQEYQETEKFRRQLAERRREDEELEKKK